MIKEHQQDYYQALEQADQQADSTPFIHFMLSVINQTLAQNTSVNAPVNSRLDAKDKISELKTPDAILSLLAQTPDLTRQQLADTIGKDLRTIGRAITKLQREGKLAPLSQFLTFLRQKIVFHILLSQLFKILRLL